MYRRQPVKAMGIRKDERAGSTRRDRPFGQRRPGPLRLLTWYFDGAPGAWRWNVKRRGGTRWETIANSDETYLGTTMRCKQPMRSCPWRRSGTSPILGPEHGVGLNSESNSFEL